MQNINSQQHFNLSSSRVLPF